MNVEALLALVALALLANLAMIVATPGRERADGGLPPDREAWRPWWWPGTRDGDRTAETDAAAVEEPAGDSRPAIVGRVVRVVTWVFLFTATAIVVVANLWTERLPAILGLLALAGLYALVVHDRLVPRVAASALGIVESALALLFAGSLVGLTGGATSPFFFAFPLLVGGAALSTSPRGTLALTAAATLTYLAAIVVDGQPLAPEEIAVVGINFAALMLLAYVGMFVGREQRRARLEAHRLATIDMLTGLRTRAHLFTALEREMIRSQRTGRRFCLLMVDLDDLKSVNDRFGHLEGDRVLRGVGEVIRDGIRRIDTAARYGGDEFVVLLPETDPTGGWVLAEKIRQGIGERRFRLDGEDVRTTASVGLVTYPDDGETINELLVQADAAMYGSKRAGRDRISGVPVMDAPTPGPGSRRGAV